MFNMESIIVSGGTKEQRYQALIPQIEALCAGENDIIANMANICAALREVFDFFWIGFYIVRKSDTHPDGERLVLGPFQGPVACTSIAYGRGVCGTAWRERRVIIVPDVDQFPGHIACSSLSRSEIVVPVIKNENVTAVLDLDSKELASFDEVDSKYLQQILTFLNQQ